METFELIMRSIICIIFPIIVSMLFAARDKNLSNESKNYYLEVSLFSSVYLLTKLVEHQNTLYFILILNIPLFIGLRKNKNVFSIVLSSILILYYYLSFGYNLPCLIVSYVLLNILNIKLSKKYFNIIVIIYSVIYFINHIIIYNRVIYSFTSIILFLVVYFFSAYVIKESDKIIQLNYDFKSLEKEKKLKQSLFQITHEIKNPLTVCSGYIQMLQNESDINKYKKYTAIIGEELKHALLILEDFKTLNKVEVNKQNMNLCALLDEIVENFEDVINYKKIKFIYTLDVDIYINGDYDRLKQVFLNILKNSVEALDTRNNPFIKITVNDLKNYVYVIIEDNGIGMDKDSIDKIFDSFYTTKSNGTGLGLYISKEIIEKHNGTISYTSILNKGTTCTIKIKK